MQVIHQNTQYESIPSLAQALCIEASYLGLFIRNHHGDVDKAVDDIFNGDRGKVYKERFKIIDNTDDGDIKTFKFKCTCGFEFISTRTTLAKDASRLHACKDIVNRLPKNDKKITKKGFLNRQYLKYKRDHIKKQTFGYSPLSFMRWIDKVGIPDLCYPEKLPFQYCLKSKSWTNPPLIDDSLQSDEYTLFKEHCTHGDLKKWLCEVGRKPTRATKDSFDVDGLKWSNVWL